MSRSCSDPTVTYTGLKEFIKDELTRMDRPTTLLEIIEETVKIDNRFRERFLEKKSFYSFRKKQSNRRKYRDPIELDAAYRKP
jgi:hypothetical protein